MRLIKCYISSFGALKNFAYDFKEGLNTIKEKNGFGKSTLATFIKSMFYGLNGSGKRGIEDNERKKFKPWNSDGLFGGYLIFQYADKQFKIERYFGAKESEDTVELIDLESGLPIQKNYDIGRRIFEIDEDGFLSTTYFSQKDFEIKPNASITAKFNRVSEVDEINGVDDVIKRLEEKQKEYAKQRGEGGLIYDATQELLSCEREIQEAYSAQTFVEDSNAMADKLQAEYDELSEKNKELTERIEKATRLNARAENVKMQQQRLVEYRDELDKARAKAQNANALLNGHFPDEKELADVEQALAESEKLSAEQKRLAVELATYEENTKVEPTKKRSLLLYAIMAAVCFSVGIVTAFFNFVVGIVLAVLSVAIFTFAFFANKNNIKKKNDVYAPLIADHKSALENTERALEHLQNKIYLFFARFDFIERADLRMLLYKIRVELTNHREATEDIERLLPKIQDLEKELSVDKAETVKTDVDALKLENAGVLASMNTVMKELSNRRAAAVAYENKASQLPELLEKQATLKEKISILKEELRICKLTTEYIKKADEAQKIKYRAPLRSSFNKYLSIITAGTCEGDIDVNLGVTIMENGKAQNPAYYSKGYQNLFEICKRFALTDVLFTKEKPFIILDDPFFNLDEDKITAATEVLRRFSEEYQIIYLICHGSRAA